MRTSSAPIAAAISAACVTALVAESDPSVPTRIFLNMRSPLNRVRAPARVTRTITRGPERPKIYSGRSGPRREVPHSERRTRSGAFTRHEPANTIEPDAGLARGASLDRKELIAGVQLFQSLTDADREALARSFVRHTFDRGEMIVRQGDPAAHLYLVEAGRV